MSQFIWKLCSGQLDIGQTGKNMRYGQQSIQKQVAGGRISSYEDVSLLHWMQWKVLGACALTRKGGRNNQQGWVQKPTRAGAIRKEQKFGFFKPIFLYFAPLVSTVERCAHGNHYVFLQKYHPWHEMVIKHICSKKTFSTYRTVSS